MLGKSHFRALFLILAVTLGILLLKLYASSEQASIFYKQQISKYVENSQNCEASESSSNENPSPRENATFVVLARNTDLNDMLITIQSYEDRFNHRFHYDWVFLNNEEFSEDFINSTRVLVSGKSHYGLIPKEHWGYPEWIDQNHAKETRRRMKNSVVYGGSESYRHMCRYESGLFYRHPLMKNYRYYWRVEPSTRVHNDVKYDVFKFMRESKKVYGFTIALLEFQVTVETLWNTTMQYLSNYPQHLAKDNTMEFVSDDKGETYNLCHFWSNFEIGDIEFFAGKAYSDYFDYLDRAGGFYYERWGDAPIHSLAASLMLSKKQVHFFNDIGYTHPPFTHCPVECGKTLACTCHKEQNFDWTGYSCLSKYLGAIDSPIKAP